MHYYVYSVTWFNITLTVTYHSGIGILLLFLLLFLGVNELSNMDTQADQLTEEEQQLMALK